MSKKKLGRNIVQGDVILEPVLKLPKNAKKVEIEERFDRLVLQESEVTGHFHHFMPDADVALYRDEDFSPKNKTITPDEGKYIVIKGQIAKLFHGKGFVDDPAKQRTGDHKVLPVKPGIYKVRITQEYDYLAKESRAVRD